MKSASCISETSYQEKSHKHTECIQNVFQISLHCNILVNTPLLTIKRTFYIFSNFVLMKEQAGTKRDKPTLDSYMNRINILLAKVKNKLATEVIELIACIGFCCEC